jgi:DNA-binding Xre family transcriptional regulator
MTKLEEILLERDMSQGDLIKIINKNTGQKLGRDRVSKICTGRLKNYTIRTAVMIKDALEVKFEDFIEYDIPKKDIA